ncbi:hypothetical protein CGLAU_05015 [Corynebacterium glaucum]|uniref:Uncharacterized protein n=2 Tax=Corynebacterium glaucum TaxID=187491 RepID=A0A1Q2HVU7_9CORY|nr:hypothetical protein CGLAU_05015 [Corynebacterium glaucum]
MQSMFNTSATTPITTPTALANDILTRSPETVDALHAIMHHPRSLSRPSATWRPPVKTLPRTGGSEQLTAAVTRRRVGPRARARIRGYGQTQVPAYLIELRITDPSGLPVDRRVAEAWVRALVPDEAIEAVHELPATRAANYVWLVDGQFNPIESPSSMFEGLVAA